MEIKDQRTELATRLREAAKLQDPIAMAAITYIKLTLDVLKDSLVTTDGDDMLRKQGAAREVQRLHKELTIAPPTIQQES